MTNEAVRIAHDSGFPPFAEVKDGKSVELAVDIFRAVTARAAVDVKIVPVSFEHRQLGLADGARTLTSTCPTSQGGNGRFCNRDIDCQLGCLADQVKACLEGWHCHNLLRNSGDLSP